MFLGHFYTQVYSKMELFIANIHAWLIFESCFATSLMSLLVIRDGAVIIIVDYPKVGLEILPTQKS